MQELDKLDANSIRGALEAMLLVSSDPVSATDLAAVLGITPGEASEALADLAAEYSDANRGFQLREVAGGWRLFTHPAFHDQVEALVMSWDTRKLSQAALETLAVIAYHQPVTREGVKAIRGVNSDGVIASLVDKGLVREAGRDPQRAQAIRYATTQAFLGRFGLKSLRELPDLEQFAPDEESKKFIRDVRTVHWLEHILLILLRCLDRLECILAIVSMRCVSRSFLLERAPLAVGDPRTS